MTGGPKEGKPRVSLPVVESGAGGGEPATASEEAAPLRDEDLPELCDEVIGAATLGALFADLRSETRVFSVSLKAQGARRAEAGEASLASAEEELLRGSIGGAQIRYEYRGAVWIDTLLPRSDGFRLVRIRHELG